MENLTTSIWPPTISSSLMKNFHLRDKTSRPSTLLSNPKTWCIVAQVFSDHGSTLNPLSTLHNLKVDCAHLRSSTMIVPEFNDTKGEVFGEINLEVEIGRPYSRSFKTWSWMLLCNLLPGRPCIHKLGEVRSLLHENVIRGN